MSEQNKKSGKSREEIALAYVSEPWWYDVRGFFILTFAYNSTLTSQLRFFGANFGDRHLEVACGTGTLLEMVLLWRKWKRKPLPHIVAMDYSESMLAGAIRRFSHNPKIELLHADAADLPLPNGQFNTANIANSVHCFPDVASALRDIQRVLVPGGSLAINVLLNPRGHWPMEGIAKRINRWGIKKGILYATYEPETVRALLDQAGFDITTATISGNCFNVLASKRIK